MRNVSNLSMLNNAELYSLTDSEPLETLPDKPVDILNIIAHYFQEHDKRVIKDKYKLLAKNYIQLYNKTKEILKHDTDPPLQEWDLSKTTDPDFPTFLRLCKTENYATSQVITGYVMETFKGPLMITVNDKTRGTYTVCINAGNVRVTNEFIITELHEAIIARIKEHIATFMRLSSELYITTPENILVDITSLEHLYVLKEAGVRLNAKDIDRLRMIKKIHDDITDMPPKKFIKCAIPAFVQLQDMYNNECAQVSEAYVTSLQSDLSILS